MLQNSNVYGGFASLKVRFWLVWGHKWVEEFCYNLIIFDPEESPPNFISEPSLLN